MRFLTDYKRVEGLGSAHDGVHHWWVQRMTAIALLVLGPLFLFRFANALGGSYEAVRATYGNWWNAFIAAAFVITAMWHLVLGLQVVIEDYTGGAVRVALLILVQLLGWALGAAGVFAVATLAISA
ncbi:MAG: succinate dehydrogenase, hydrophobic membrane anchor protein [Alphaproteobacteria bacterium]|nr:MAG: succinate dehydrogenase, hydrophobic membrane anchor protein [Alphaproteobacteria bacterium]